MGLDIDKYKVKIKLEENMLGTVPRQKDIYSNFIASKAPPEVDAEEEVMSVKEMEEKGWTRFHQDKEGNFIYDYGVKGFLKEAARTLKVWGTMKQLRDKVSRYCFVTPRKIRLPEVAGALERPLRCQTAQGERVALAKSDFIAAGTELEFNLEVLEISGLTKACLTDILSYGHYQGVGQWRSGGYGRFSLISIKEAK